MNRYDGKPILRLVEMYILYRIGMLGDEQAGRLREMQPRLSATFKIDGTWDQIIEGVLKLPADYGARVKGHWDGFVEHEQTAGRPVDAEAYVRDFVDRNILPDAPA
jgi:hypothetical protein